MSSSDTETLVRMANQIAGFFASQGAAGDMGKAEAGTLDHVVKFWDPRMRAKMAAHLAAGGEGLHPLAARALAGLEELKKAN